MTTITKIRQNDEGRGEPYYDSSKQAKALLQLLQVSTREFFVESLFVVDEPIITLLVAHSLGRTLWGESVIGSRICANMKQHEKGKTAK